MAHLNENSIRYHDSKHTCLRKHWPLAQHLACFQENCTEKHRPLTNAWFCIYSWSYSRYLKPKWAATRSSTLRRIPMKRSSCSFLLKVAALPRLVSAYTKTQVVFQAGNPNYQMINTQCAHTLHSLKAPLVISSVIFSCNERGRIRCSIYIWTALTLCHCTLEEKTKLHNYYSYIRSSPHTIPYTTS